MTLGDSRDKPLLHHYIFGRCRYHKLHLSNKMTGQEKLTLVLGPKRPRKSGFSSTRFSHLFQSWHWFLATFLSSGPRRSHGRMPTFFHLWPYFHLSHFFPVWVGTEREIDLFDIFWGCSPGAGILPLSMYISISALDIQSFCLGDSAQIRPALILLFAYSNVSLLFKFPVCYFQIF